MKKLIIISVFFLFSYSITYSQVTVEGVNINDLEIKYCQIVGYNVSLLGKKLVITVDYGQKYKFWKRQNIVDKDRNIMFFNSMVDALNFMEKNNWEYVNNTEYSVLDSRVSRFLLKKKE